MKCKDRFIKIFAVLILSIVALSFSFQGPKNALNPNQAHFIPDCKYVRNVHWAPGCRSSTDEQTLNPMDRIFQLIFILFFISPPLIVILLFLIWREMKVRNKMK